MLGTLWMMACTPDPAPGCVGPDCVGDPCADDPTGIVCTVAGDGNMGTNGVDLPALESWLFQPTSGAIDPDGRFVLADYNNYLIRRIDEDGVLRTIAGSGGHSYAVEGEPALDCPLENPVDVAIGPDGTLYINEQHAARILRVKPGDGIVHTYVGSPTEPGYDAYRGDGGPAIGAGISQSVGIALADDGTLYLADTGNNVVRVITPDGVIDTLAGHPVEDEQPHQLVDGIGAEAEFWLPWGIDVDEDYVYVSDPGLSAIRRIDRATAEVVTLGGTGVRGSTGDGVPALEARLAGPMGIAVGPDRGLYVADSESDAIRRIDLDDGTITTVMGTLDHSGFAGDGGPPEDALLYWPNDVIIAPNGDLYVIDTLNSRVRVVRGYLATE